MRPIDADELRKIIKEQPVANSKGQLLLAKDGKWVDLLDNMPTVDAAEVVRREIEKFAKWLNGKFEFDEGCFIDCEYGEVWQVKKVINKYESECKNEIN